MTEHDLHLLKLFVKKLAEKLPKHVTEKRSWKELNGVEWTEKLIKADWEKDRPNYSWWKDFK